MFSVGQAFHMGKMHVLLRRSLMFLMRDSTEQGVAGALGLGVRGSAYIIMDMTSTQDEDLEKSATNQYHTFSVSPLCKTYLLHSKQPSDA